MNIDSIAAILDEELLTGRDYLASWQQSAIDQQVKNFRKKFTPKRSEAADAAATIMFLDCNARCLGWSTDRFSDQILNDAALFLNSIISHEPGASWSVHELRQTGSLGPGVNVGSRETNFIMKMFCAPLTHTGGPLYDLYRSAIDDHPTWRISELERSARWGTPVVEGSKLSCVEKYTHISRTICAEPTLNMFFQLSIGAFIERLLRRHFRIDLSRQPDVNRELARIGSVNGSYCTIDLASASDTIATGLVRYLIPPVLLRWLELTRSSATKVEKSFHRLHMFSSMGNGFTFPLQTLIFASLVRAVYRDLDIPFRCRTSSELPSFGVFGDDIIVVPEAYDAVVTALASWGFTVNGEKSFKDGPFRESCGEDWYLGRNVRAFYARSYSTTNEAYVVHNGLKRWSERVGIGIPNTLSAIIEDIPRNRRYAIPPALGDDCGLKFSSHAEASTFYKDQKPARSRDWYWTQEDLLKLKFSKFVPNVTRVAGLNGDRGVPCSSSASLMGAISGYFTPTGFTPRESGAYKVRSCSAVWYTRPSADPDLWISNPTKFGKALGWGHIGV